MQVAVSDSTCLIGFERIGRLELLKSAYEQILIPYAVSEEYGEQIEWLTVREIANRPLFDALSTHLDRGEAEAIALATEITGAVVILDDRRARKIAFGMGLPVIGSFGILIRLKRSGFLDSIRPVMNDLMKAGFHAADDVIRQALRMVGELDSGDSGHG